MSASFVVRRDHLFEMCVGSAGLRGQARIELGHLSTIRAGIVIVDDVQPQEPKTRRPWNRLSEKSRAQVITRYQSGKTSSVLAQEYGVAKSTILNILRANNVVVRRQSPPPEIVAEAARLHVSGLSLSLVAEQLDVNQETMRVAILAAGVVVRPARHV